MIEFQESDIENYLLEEDYHLKDIIGVGEDSDVCIRSQVNLYPYGISDILVFDKTDEVIHIVELKAVGLKPKDINQVSRYKKGLKELFPHVDIKCHLIGLKKEVSDWIYTAQNTNGIEYYMYEVGLASGVEFEKVKPEGWSFDIEDIDAEKEKILLQFFTKEEVEKNFTSDSEEVE